jgi:hypothetical protein
VHGAPARNRDLPRHDEAPDDPIAGTAMIARDPEDS